ncbi:MAG: bifunctional adenosylcobinamide kinase/adenosylcobinamide-phosphate guanylyltransferase [Elusimicrobia bacterium]|nr:bifunctional adenosylcobinamide kinase/adenosylcobinamide-phosphate guanylyltransferase [Elusimicrobiota bacterium]
MGKITFILGGVRSGKSSYAIELAKKKKNVIFVATAMPFDNEMKIRIEKHKKSRPKSFKTIEIKDNLSDIYKKDFDTAIIDCLTIFVSNCMLYKKTEEKIVDNVRRFLSEFKSKNKNMIIVSNEVGMGIVPKNKLARDFRDILGRVNQVVAEYADEVYFLIAGIPMTIKKI